MLNYGAKLGNDESSAHDLAKANGMIGDSHSMLVVYRQALGAAGGVGNVLIEGETGTGKELIARFVHRASARAAGPFVAINCAGIPRELLEAELFGSERGAFTGAVDRPGHFEVASRGTIFLDEIGDLPLAAQAVLLRVLDHKTVRRLGGRVEVPTDARVLAATNVDLNLAVASRLFRADLLYRLRQLHIRLPALRDRREDIGKLIDHFLFQRCEQLGITKRLSDNARQVLIWHAWPGNVRELEHAIGHGFSCSMGDAIETDDLPIAFRHASTSLSFSVPPRPRDLSLTDAAEEVRGEVERQWIIEEIGRTKTLGEASQSLKIDARTLYEKMRKYGIRRDS